jgi:hypothetical protein
MGNGMGVMLHTGDLAYPDLIRYAQESEKLDYDTFYVTEESGKEAFSLLGVLAQNTSTIGLGSSIINFYSRTPTLLAMGARSMHELSGGRFGPFGLGTGGVGFMQRGHGIELDRPIGSRTRDGRDRPEPPHPARTTYDGKWFNVTTSGSAEGGLEEEVPTSPVARWPRSRRWCDGGEGRDGVITNWMMTEFEVAEGGCGRSHEGGPGAGSGGATWSMSP